MTVYRKLVRDRIPQIIERAGKVPTYRRLGMDEFRVALRAKVVEEAQEVAEASDDALLSELADLAEVLDATLDAFGFTHADLKVTREHRGAERGLFAERILIERVDG